MNSVAEEHLEAALRLVGAESIQKWVALRLAPPKRGRRAGAAVGEKRCQWRIHGDGEQCKNGKAVDSNYCRMHASKSALIDETETASASVSSSAE